MKVLWTRSAVQDLRDLEAYIAADSPYYARQFVGKILASTRKLQHFQRLGRKVPEAEQHEIRELIVQPYRVIYRLTSTKVEIVAVVHGARDLAGLKPKPWEVG